MDKPDKTKASKNRFRHVLIAFVILLAYSAVQAVTFKTVWGKQVSWMETVIMAILGVTLAVAACFYLSKKDENQNE